MKTAAEAAAAWAADVTGITTTAAYPQAGKAGGLPDIVAATQTREQQLGGDQHYFPFAALQQTWLVIFVIELSLMVEVDGEDESDAQAAHEALEGYADELGTAIASDAELGGELEAPQMASATFRVDLAQPFIEYADGTRGRALFANMAIAQPIDEPGSLLLPP